jgi:DNA (cytosine-5)-methyltransferase 1
MNIVSLFSGAGGLDLGLIQAGHSIIWANDNDRDAVETYQLNIGRHIVLADISSVPASEIPVCDVVVGGFPCQGFSQANLLRAELDDRNRLYLEFLRIVQERQPKYFLAENVRGILSLAGGRAIERIEQDFSRAGYRVSKQLFNMADFGVPQLRKRVIIAGTRADLPYDSDFVFPEPTHLDPILKKNGGRKPWLSIREALSGLPDPGQKHALVNHIYSQYKVTNRNFTGHRTTNPDRPSPTILARGNGKGGVCAIQHPDNLRRMTIREQALIQTFPLDFEFSGKMNSCYRQVGNAVPVRFGKMLGEQLVLSQSRREAA